SEDPVWLWTTTPDRYVDSALRYAIASNPDIRLVDIRGAPTVRLTLVSWEIDAARSPRMVGAVEVQVTTVERAIHSEMIRGEEPIAADLPGDLAAAAGPPLRSLSATASGRA